MKKFFSRTIDAGRVRTSVFVFFFLMLAGLGFFSIAAENFSGKNIFQDVDQDGLTDDEERLYGTDSQKYDTDGDGYGDGAEVRSGYDPLRSAPGDRVSLEGSEGDVSGHVGSTDKVALSEAASSLEGAGGVDDAETDNLTEQVSEQIAEILKQSSEEGADVSLSLQDIQKNLEELLSARNVGAVDLPEIDDEDILIKKQAYDDLSKEERASKIKEDTLEYVTKVVYVLASHMPGAITEPEDLEALAEDMMGGIMTSIESGDAQYFDDLIEKGERALLELGAIEVPENMLDSHKKAIQLFQYASTLPEELESSDTDPLANVVVLSKMQGIFSALSSFAKQVDADMKEIGIEEIPVELGS